MEISRKKIIRRVVREFSFLCSPSFSLMAMMSYIKFMSQKKIFRCQECGYETEIYEGRGFMGQHIEAMSCPDCRNIVPLVVGGVIGDAAPSFNSLVGRLCLRCGSARIHRWDMHTLSKPVFQSMPSIPLLHIAVLLWSAVFRQVYDAIWRNIHDSSSL